VDKWAFFSKKWTTLNYYTAYPQKMCATCGFRE